SSCSSLIRIGRRGGFFEENVGEGRGGAPHRSNASPASSRPLLGSPYASGEPAGQGFDASFSRKFISTVAGVVIGSPCFSPGLKRHCFTASTALSSRPIPKERFTLMLFARPSGVISMYRRTMPSV